MLQIILIAIIINSLSDNLISKNYYLNNDFLHNFKDLKDNYSNRLDRHSDRLKVLEDWKTERVQSIKDERLYSKFLIALGLVILSVLIYHLTGVKFF